MNNERMQFWIKNGYNVLFVGKHGTGKSSMIIDAFNAAGLKWKYFSASTMDPWVDFIGVPKEQKDGDKSYLELVRPKSFQEDDVEAIFLDEFNRSPKKVRNAVMELIQFRSINGKKFEKLKVVWAAINPDDKDTDSGDENMQYDVEKLDPAQKDRFHVQVEIPYKPDVSYFKQKYGNIGESAVKWWTSLDGKVKDLISPRRLDYALKVFVDGGDIDDVLPKQANRSELNKLLSNSDTFREMDSIFKSKDNEKAKAFLADESKWRLVSQFIQDGNVAYLDFWGKHVPAEHASNMLGTATSKFGKWVIDLATVKNDKWACDLCKEIVVAGANGKAVGAINKAFKKFGKAQTVRNWLLPDINAVTFTAPNSVTNSITNNTPVASVSNIKNAYSAYSSSTIRNIHILRDVNSLFVNSKNMTMDDAKYLIREILTTIVNFQIGTIQNGMSGQHRNMSTKSFRDTQQILNRFNQMLKCDPIQPIDIYSFIAINFGTHTRNYHKLKSWFASFIK